MKKINEEDLKMVTGGNTQGKKEDPYCLGLVNKMLNDGSIKESEREQEYDACLEEAEFGANVPVPEIPSKLEEHFDLS